MFSDTRGHLHLCDKKNETIYAGSPNNVFFETHLYRFLNPITGKHSNIVEKELSEIESDAAPVVQKIIRSARSLRNPFLSGQERYKWALFYYAQSRRTPENLASCLADDAALSERADALGVTLHEIDGMIMQRGMPFFASGVAAGLREEEYYNNVGLMTAVVLHPKRGFVMGSCGVPLGSADPDIFFRGWLPLAPDIAVRATIWTGKEILVPIPRHAKEVAQRINLTTARQSRIIAARSEADLRAVIRRLDP